MPHLVTRESSRVIRFRKKGVVNYSAVVVYIDTTHAYSAFDVQTSVNLVFSDQNKVGGFVWPAERARDGDVETILASSSAAPSVVASSLSSGGGSNHAPPSMMLEPRSVKQKEKTAEAQVISSRERQRRSPQQEQEQHEQEQLRGEGLNILSARCRASTSSSHSGGSTQRSDSTCAPSSSSSTGSYSSSRQSSFRSTASSFSEHQNRGRRGNSNRSSTSSSSRSRRRTQRPTSYESTNRFATLTTVAEQHLSHRSSKSSARENRLRPPILRAHGTPPTSSSAPSATRLPRVHALDPVFDRHHKYDLIAEERAAQGGEVTGRFGKVQGSSVLAASLLTSELSTPWSHVLRGQKW